ncbi:MAG: flagellar basal-body rod protein FlgF [Deltaproteobacteria bacterium]|nr:flagellar basal-body rod protein FlgF [Deltaproteobacteria bacterium]
MSDGIYSALSGAIAQQRSLDVVANNVANANTTGYRGDRVAFQEALVRSGGNGAAPDCLRFVGVSQVRADTAQGALRQTGNPLDVALQGDGFFAVETPSGVRYTRAGAFVTDQTGMLQTMDGHAVLAREVEGERTLPRIRFPAGTREVVIATDGTVSADGVPIGRIKVVRFEQPNQLAKQGATLFVAGQGQPVADDETQVVQGHLEGANVNAVAGLNELITVSRSFESFQRVIQAFRELDSRTAREVASR